MSEPEYRNKHVERKYQKAKWWKIGKLKNKKGRVDLFITFLIEITERGKREKEEEIFSNSFYEINNISGEEHCKKGKL